MVKVGDKLPSVDLFENTLSNKVNTSELTANKKVIIFGVPGAFTPGCDNTHLPGYTNNAERLKAANGLQEIICVAVNDPFVLAAWGKLHDADGKVRLLSDPTAEFVTALDLAIDLPLMGKRSKRFSMIVNNGVIKELNVEPDGTGLTCSLASNIGKKLQVAKPY